MTQQPSFVREQLSRPEVLRRLLGLAYRLTKIAPGVIDANDLAQLTLIKALRAESTLQQTTEDSFYSWLFKIARNQLFDLVREQKRKREANSDPALLEATRDEHEFEEAILNRDEVEVIFSRLTPLEVAVLRAKAAGMSHEQIGRILNRTTDAVRKLFSRVNAKAREAAKKDEVDSNEPAPPLEFRRNTMLRFAGM